MLQSITSSDITVRFSRTLDPGRVLPSLHSKRRERDSMTMPPTDAHRVGRHPIVRAFAVIYVCGNRWPEIDDQIEHCSRYAARFNLQVDEVFRDGSCEAGQPPLGRRGIRKALDRIRTGNALIMLVPAKEMIGANPTQRAEVYEAVDRFGGYLHPIGPFLHL